jgi:hypothetical protein
LIISTRSYTPLTLSQKKKKKKKKNLTSKA